MINYQENIRKISSTIAQERINYQGINLIKEVKDLNWENNVTLMREIEDNANKWKGILCSWVEALILFK